jgi:hypothetical protein
MKFHPRVIFLIVVLAACFFIGCTPKNDPELEKKYKPGNVYSVTAPGQENGFNIVKVLGVTKGVVHVRIYKNKFASRADAASADPAKLSMGSNDDPEGFGLRHMPMDKETFEALAPEFIREEKLTDEELQGFKDWRAATGN